MVTAVRAVVGVEAEMVTEGTAAAGVEEIDCALVVTKVEQVTPKLLISVVDCKEIATA